MTLEDGAVITRTYDAANRQRRADFMTGSGQDGGFQTFDYGDAGRLAQAAQTMGGHTTVTAYGYSAVGDVVSTTQQLDGGTAWLTQYANDYVQGTRTITYPSGAVRVYQMDSLNRLDAVETGDSTLIADYAYDVVNHFNTLAYANGLSNRVDYNALGWTTRVSSAVADYRYGYDDVGNRTYMQRYHQSGQPADVYQYDGLYQLTQVWYGADATDPGSITSYDHLQQYNLDLLGNRLEVQNDGAGEVYQPNDGEQSTDPLNRYETVGSNALSYDLRGNTLSDGVYTYTYDVLNRQTSVSGPGGTAEYIHDARGRRVAKIVNGVTTHYVYDTQYRVIEERDGNEVLLARYTYGSGMDEPLTMERDGETYYYHRDALGSITEVTDESGDLVERYEYDVYGAVTIFDGAGITLTASAIGNPYLFTARRYDSESGNYTYRARMYSPWLGRFLSMDPVGFDAGDYNLYRYVFNNPVNTTDPTDEFAWFVAWLAKASAEAAADALMQAAIAYFFDPTVTSVGEAIDSINWWQVGGAFGVGLIPGGRLLKAALEAAGEVTLRALEALSNCEDYTTEQALFDFATGIVLDLGGDKIADLIIEHGIAAIKKGLKKLGIDDAVEWILRELDLCRCFSADTLVTTKDGREKISALEVGDYVLPSLASTSQPSPTPAALPKFLSLIYPKSGELIAQGRPSVHHISGILRLEEIAESGEILETDELQGRIELLVDGEFVDAEVSQGLQPGTIDVRPVKRSALSLGEHKATIRVRKTSGEVLKYS